MNTNIPLYCVVLLMFQSQAGLSQQVHRVPFHSNGNTIELEISNDLGHPISMLVVRPIRLPPWLTLDPENQEISYLQTREHRTVQFQFAVEEYAPVHHPEKIEFAVTSRSGTNWKTEVALSISPPSSFQLSQNYPNPFNPETRISYELHEDSHVVLAIFNVTGQVIATLADDVEDAGYHEVIWNAANFAGSVYMVRLSAYRENGEELFQATRKIMLLK